MLKRICSCIVILIFSASVFACGSNNNNEIKEIRIGYFPNLTHPQALAGMAEGYFQEKFGDEVVVSFHQFNAGPAELEAFFAGEIDIGYIGPIPALTGYIRSDGDIKIIAGASNAGAVLVTRKGLKLADVKELDGLTVAVPQYGNTQHLELLYVLAENGLKPTDKGGTVTVIPSQNPEIKTLMDSGQIDAACVPEPWGTRLITEIGANILLDYDELLLEGNYSTAAVITSDDFLTAHSDLVEKFMEAHIELTEMINGNPTKYKDIINRQIGELTTALLAPEILDGAFSKIIVSVDPATESINEFMNIYIGEGFTDDIKAPENLYDFSVLNKILRKNGMEVVE